MRAVVMTRYGGRSVVELRDVAEPKPEPAEVLVDVRAAGLNPVDLKIRAGQLRPIQPHELPAVMGNELAGVVREVGAKVTRFKPGDAVYGRVPRRALGAFAERCVVPEDALALMPSALSFEEAAGVPLVALTVRRALVEIADLESGQTVFIKAGSGGIGTFAIQYARALGARVIATTSTKNVALVRGLGADEVVDYTRQRFEDVVSGCDVVLDSVDGDDVSRDVKVLKLGGHLLSLVGPPDAAFAKSLGLNPLMRIAFAWLSRKETRAARAAGVRYTFFLVEADGAALTEMGPLFDSGQVKPVVDRVFELDDVRAALDHLARGRSRGKVILRVARSARPRP